jgi:hypothetical protein
MEIVDLNFSPDSGKSALPVLICDPVFSARYGCGIGKSIVP